MPRKSGHMCNAGLAIIQHGARCPDLSGPGTALRRGHEIKKTSPYSHESFFLNNPEAKRRGHVLKCYEKRLHFTGLCVNDSSGLSTENTWRSREDRG